MTRRGGKGLGWIGALAFCILYVNENGWMFLGPGENKSKSLGM